METSNRWSSPGVIGPHRILRPLGAGGVGEVFLACRADDQYQRQVAVKVLRQRFDGDAKRRILAERQILARLEHRHIARLYDGGTTEDDRPYMVMEYVDGQPIDTYCAGHRLALAARLALFTELCSAVQAAHRSLVVHRDLKPANILVTEAGELKLLDFSSAKAAVAGLDPPSAETAAGYRPMTLAFASPEQVRGEPETAATDVHGLGIVLYRMLTGRHPFPVAGKPPHAVAETICSHQPIAPSRAVSSRARGAAGRQTARGAGLPTRHLSRDLDAIVLKALEKCPRDRYPSAEQLAADLDRFRRRRPTLARPRSLGYRWRRAASRHRALLLFAGLASLLVAAFVLALVAQSRRTDAALGARAVELADTIDDLAVALHDQGEHGEAESLLLESLALRQRLQRPDPHLARVLDNLAALTSDRGRDAEAEVRRTARLWQEAFGNDDPALGDAWIHLGILTLRSDRLEQAERALTESHRTLAATYSPDHPWVAVATLRLAHLRLERRRLRAAEELAIASLERALGSLPAPGASDRRRPTRLHTQGTDPIE